MIHKTQIIINPNQILDQNFWSPNFGPKFLVIQLFGTQPVIIGRNTATNIDAFDLLAPSLKYLKI